MFEFLLSAIYPPKCPYCGKNIKYGMNECTVCRASFPKYPRIEPVPLGEVCVAPFTYDGGIRQALIDYKFYGKKINEKSFSGIVAHTVSEVYKDMDFEVITAVPMRADRVKKRGYNQAEQIAEGMAKILGKPYEKLLVKTQNNKEQHGLGAEDRIKNVIGVYSVEEIQKVKGRKILIVDDIMTTGCTLAECCRTLRSAGASRILCATVAIAGESKF